MGKRKNIYVQPNDLVLLSSLKELHGPTDSDVYRAGLKALSGLPLRNAHVEIKNPGEASPNTEAAERKKRVIDKAGGPFVMCPKHGGYISSCWNLHT